MEKLYEMFAKTVAGTALIIATLMFGGLVLSFPVKWAWNYAIVGIFHLKEIGYWEAFCLIGLCGVFFKGSPSPSSKSESTTSV